MKYFKKGSDTFIENGPSLIRVGEILTIPSPVFGDRTVRVFDVLQIKKRGENTDGLKVGNRIALSFPNKAMLANEYEWSKNGQWEEKQVPLVDKKTKPAPKIKELIHSNN